MDRVSLTHVWTKETISLEVETITATYVALRWPLQGVYDLNLAKNVITARSLKAQRKNHQRPMWEASDIVAVRKMVRDHLAKAAGERMVHKAPLDVREAMKRHNQSMPSAIKKV